MENVKGFEGINIYDYEEGAGTRNDIQHADLFIPRHDLGPTCAQNLLRHFNETSNALKDHAITCRGDFKHNKNDDQEVDHPSIIHFGIPFTKTKDCSGSSCTWQSAPFGENKSKFYRIIKNEIYTWEDENGKVRASSTDLWWGWKGLCNTVEEKFKNGCHEKHETFPMANPTSTPQNCPDLCHSFGGYKLKLNKIKNQYFGQRHVWDETQFANISIDPQYGFIWKSNNTGVVLTTLLPDAQCPNEAKLVLRDDSWTPVYNLCDARDEIRMLDSNSTILQSNKTKMEYNCNLKQTTMSNYSRHCPLYSYSNWM